MPQGAWCGLGSVKTNVGHLETAAGIAGVVKILLAMKHREIPANVHFSSLNQHIRLEGSPFYIVDRTRAWEPLPDEDGYPVLRAGCSSFGFGGANAHVVLEAYDAEPRPEIETRQTQGPYLFVLSAKDDERLRDAVSALARRLDDDFDLADLAYTLMVGREELEARLAIVVNSPEELKSTLAALIDGATTPANVWRNHLRGGGDALAFLKDEEDAAALVERWARCGKLDMVGRLWLAGVPVDWKRLPQASGRRRVPLPPYPFARDRHWFEDPAATLEQAAVALQPNAAEVERITAIMQPIDALEPFLRRALLSVMRRSDLAEAAIPPEHRRLFAALRALTDEAVGSILSAESCCVNASSEVGYALACPPPERSSPRAAPRRDGEGKLKHTPPIGAGTSDVVFIESREDLLVEKDRLVRENPAARPHLELAWTCLERYPEILTGKTPATEVLFPNSSMVLVEAVYRENPLADFTNRLAAAAVARHADEISAAQSRRAEIIEIGAGTGGTTEVVLRALASCAREPRFVFTDISRAFVRDARTRFGESRPFAEFDILDIEREPAPAQFDVVLAANVLHATRDIARTLRNVRALLRPGGWLVLNEITQPQTFTTMTFGLLSGWWAFEDSAKRLPHSPLLDVAGWRSELYAAGFAGVSVLGDSTGLQQHVFVAEAGAARPLEPTPPPRAASVRRTAPAQSTSNIEKVLFDLAAQCLGMPADQLDAHTPFVDLGFDSILGVEFVNRINDRLSIDLPKTVLFDHPDLAAMAAHIALEADARIASPEVRESTSGDIAVIGLAGRFPDAPDAETFWQNLAAGHCSIREAPPERWPAQGIAHNRGGFLENIDRFDPLFFNMSGLEAEMSDPQQRLFLEECWKAFEDAGYAGAALAGSRCGVYVGVAKGDYQVRLMREGITEASSFWGNEGSVLAARISYFLDLRGPSVAVNTACSSSLVALHLACQAIRTGDCAMALAGGVYVGATPNLHIMAGNAGMLSPGGVCRAFDQDADGFVPGEAVGVVVLKPLAAALRDGDRIHGVIKATGINQDGHTNGITAPSARSQTDLECEVLTQAKISPETIGFVEAHGTGTKLGDPIEFRALTDCFRRFTDRTAYCALGSVKTNIGHAITAAGITSLIKVLLALKHRQIPPSLHFTRANEHMAMEGSPFFVNTELRAWEPLEGAPRRAAISSFGFSGTNAHIIVEDAPPQTRSAPTPLPHYLLPFSARTPAELAAVLERFARWLEDRGDAVDLGDVAYTLLVGGMHLKSRVALVVSGIEELKRQLAETPRTRSDAPATRPDIAAWRTALADAANAVPRDRLEAIAAWYANGGTFNSAELAGIPGRRRVALPSYPLNRKRYWLAEKSENSGLVVPAAPLSPALETPPAATVETTLGQLRRLAAAVLKIDPADLDPAEPLDRYGMDSLGAIKFGQRLQQDFGALPADLTVTCRTLDEICRAMAPTPSPALREARVNGHSGGNGSKPAERSLLRLVQTGEIEPIHAAAFLSIPVNVLSAGVTRAQVRELFGNKPYWLNLLETCIGRLGLFFLPLFDDELYLDESRTVAAVLEACEMARQAGARTAALTGLIPSATDYARSVAAAAAGRGDMPAITTGHAVTCSAVVLAIERILEEAGRTIENESVGFLGAGSIGTAVLRLMMRRLPHPKRILLCDVFGAESRLDELRRSLRGEFDYGGDVGIAASREGVASEIYSSTLIVGATNVPNLLDATRLNPGTLIVDDPAPHCFHPGDAIERLRRHGDILFTEGGLLRLPEPVRQSFSVNASMLQSMRAEKMQALNWVGQDDPNEAMGCMLSALLSTRYSELEPTLGLIDWRTAERHYLKLKELGIGSADLHCEGFRLPPGTIRGFHDRYSRAASL